jgi:hypothetical protein
VCIRARLHDITRAHRYADASAGDADQLDALRPVKISSELEFSKLDVRIDTLNRLAIALDQHGGAF